MVHSGRGFGIAAAVPAEVVRAAAAEAEALGYDTFWVNDTPNGDGLTALAEAAAVTSVIRLGVGVIPLSRRSPESIIAQIRGVDRTADHEGTVGERIEVKGRPEPLTGLQLPLDRLWLGIGSGSAPYALGRVRAGVRALEDALDTSVFIAALGPRMSRLGGEVADGVLFNWLTPDFAQQAIEWVKGGARDADRSTPTICAYVRCALGEASSNRLRVEAERYAAVPSYADHFARMGVDPRDTAVAARTAEDLKRGLDAWDGVLDEVVVRAITARDTLEETLALVRAAAPLG
ncbi:MAG TPA: LLM class flavin-dependent oxidoreductase [Thermomicrobiaceae bacterium]|nr:LLM class flavin-dependent oxidoreductase [Thermomicrobiaceae bacterium]